VTPRIWRKSSYSTEGTSAQCVEVAKLAGAIGVRDSRHPDGGHLTLTFEQFGYLVRHIKNAAG
jgi:hypothetical protein